MFGSNILMRIEQRLADEIHFQNHKKNCEFHVTLSQNTWKKCVLTIMLYVARLDKNQANSKTKLLRAEVENALKDEEFIYLARKVILKQPTITVFGPLYRRLNS